MSSSENEFSDSVSEEDEELSLSESEEETSVKKDKNTNSKKGKDIDDNIKNQPFDEALDIESDGSVMTDSKPSPSRMSMELKNQPFDSALELSDSMSPDKASTTRINDAPTLHRQNSYVKNRPFDEEEVCSSASDSSVDTTLDIDSPLKTTAPVSSPRRNIIQSAISPIKNAPKHPSPIKKDGGNTLSSDGVSSDNESESEDEKSPTKLNVQGAYDALEFENLNVSKEIRELFQYIGRFKAQDIELESRLKCFIPEYIPAVGEMDAFLKIPRPDHEQDFLGLKVLDEPALLQSDATVLDLKLRSISKKKHGEVVVRSIESAEKNPNAINKWITSITELHKSKPPPQVHYSKSMPDIDSLMQIWPDEMEELLNRTLVPSPEMDLSLEEYARLVCALLDVPIYKHNIAESLHVIFTLFLEFQSNQHFNAPSMA